MAEDRIEELVEEAYQYFSETSIYEVVNLERPAAVMWLQRIYREVDPIRVEKYLDVLERLENEVSRC